MRRNHTVVVNATNLGRLLDGIGIYTLNFLRELSRLETRINFIVYLNRSCEEHIRDVVFPGNVSVRWVSHWISPDHKFKGHLLRLLYANFLGLKHSRRLIFTMSQLEAIFFRSNQVITIHDLIPLLFKKCHRKQHYYYEYLLPYALKSARVVITPSQHTKGLLGLCYGLDQDKIRVIHHGARRIEQNEPGSDGSRAHEFILYAGRTVRMKNVAGVLSAFGLIKEMVGHQLVITGNGADHLKEELETGKLSGCDLENDRVVFRESVSSEEMANLLQGASLLVFPSFYEGFGLPPLEAMACGCPVVVSTVASLPEVCGDAAYYIDPHDVNSIAEGMYRVLTDNSLREILTRRGLERAKLFSWEESAKSHLRAFEDATGLERPAALDSHYESHYQALWRHSSPAGVHSLYRMGGSLHE